MLLMLNQPGNKHKTTTLSDIQPEVSLYRANHLNIESSLPASVRFEGSGSPIAPFPSPTPIACSLISESVAQRNMPILLLTPTDSHPGLLVGSIQSFSMLLAAFHIDLKVVVSYSEKRRRLRPGRSKGLVLNQSSINIESVHEPIVNFSNHRLQISPRKMGE